MCARSLLFVRQRVGLSQRLGARSLHPTPPPTTPSPPPTLRLLARARLETALDELHGEAASVDGGGGVERGDNPGQGANVVLVAVGDHHRLNLVAPLGEEGGVGQDLLHPQVGEAAHGRARKEGECARRRGGWGGGGAQTGGVEFGGPAR